MKDKKLRKMLADQGVFYNEGEETTSIAFDGAIKQEAGKAAQESVGKLIKDLKEWGFDMPTTCGSLSMAYWFDPTIQHAPIPLSHKELTARLRAMESYLGVEYKKTEATKGYTKIKKKRKGSKR